MMKKHQKTRDISNPVEIWWTDFIDTLDLSLEGRVPSGPEPHDAPDKHNGNSGLGP